MRKFIFVCITSLFVTTAAFAQTPEAAQEPLPAPACPDCPECPEAAPPTPKEFRNREHNISVEYSNGRTVMKLKANGANTESDTQSINTTVRYSYNMGRIQPAISVSTSSSNDDTAKSSSFTSIIGIGMRANLKDNVPGEKFVPYVGFMMSILRIDTSSSTADSNLIGMGTVAGAGLEWYPFGEIFAFNTAISFATITGDGKVGGTSVDGTLRSLGLNLGYTFSF